MVLLNWSKLPSLTSLRAFEAVARSKSFSEAARSLNVTHAAVSQQVKTLEEYLEVVLVRRPPSIADTIVRKSGPLGGVHRTLTSLLSGKPAIHRYGSTGHEARRI